MLAEWPLCPIWIHTCLCIRAGEQGLTGCSRNLDPRPDYRCVERLELQ
jgi:hypothetical protein